MTKEEIKQIFLNKGLSERYFELFYSIKPKDLYIEDIEPCMIEKSLLIDIERHKELDLLINKNYEFMEQLLKLQINL